MCTDGRKTRTHTVRECYLELIFELWREPCVLLVGHGAGMRPQWRRTGNLLLHWCGRGGIHDHILLNRLSLGFRLNRHPRRYIRAPGRADESLGFRNARRRVSNEADLRVHKRAVVRLVAGLVMAVRMLGLYDASREVLLASCDTVVSGCEGGILSS